MKKPSLLEKVLNKVFNPIVNDVKEETQSLSEKSKERFNQSRRDFFNRSVPTIVASGVLSQELLVKDMTPPKDPLVEQLTREVEMLRAKQEIIEGGRFIQYPLYYGSAHATTCGFNSCSGFLDTRSNHPNDLKEM